MLTVAQILAENLTPITDEQALALEILVKQFGPYRSQSGLWPNFATKVAAEQSVPTVKTKGLKAALTQLAKLPPIVVESEGSGSSRSFLSTKQNWDMLAQDVLDILYEVPIATGATMIAVAQRRIQGMVIDDDMIIRRENSGRRY
jgi:hypothetical protein